jgi:hypothetical protein
MDATGVPIGGSPGSVRSVRSVGAGVDGAGRAVAPPSSETGKVAAALVVSSVDGSMVKMSVVE